jgi:SAM-dependent methyltransferase
VEDVLRAVGDLEERRLTGREARVLEPSRELQALMIREAAVYVRQQVREKAALANDLREAEGAAAAGSADWATRMRAELQAAQEAAHHATQAVAQRAAEMQQLRQDLELRALESQRLALTLEAQAQEVTRLRDDIRGILRDYEHAGGNGALAPDGVLPPAPAAPANPPVAQPTAPANEAPADEILLLRSAMERLENRIRELEPRVRPMRRTPRELLVDLVIGSKYYPRRPEPPMPRVTIVTPVRNAADTIRATVESVLAQNYHSLEYIVVDGGSTDGTTDILREYEDRIDRILTGPDAGPMDAVAKGFQLAEGEVLSYLCAGDLMEPGGVLRVAEFFARRRRVSVVYFEDAIAYPGGWKFPAPAQPTADVYHLLRLARQGRRFTNAVFFRRSAYLALGPMDPRRFGRAADWELWVRLARRFELRRVEGHVRSVPVARVLTSDAAYATDVAKACQSFEGTFGRAGRIRCRLIDAASRVFDALRFASRGPRLFFPLAPDDARGDMPLPPDEPPTRAAAQPICPLTDRHPDRLLFSTQDTTGGDSAIHHVYYDSSSGTAIASPPAALERMASLYARREAQPAAAVAPPDPKYRSPYARFRGSFLGRLLQHVPSPYWWFNKPDFADATGDEALRALRGVLDPADENVRLLNVGCFDGGMLDRIKAQTRWRLVGTETNNRAAAQARAKGYVVWEVAAQEAPLVLPVGESFDVIFLANSIEHLPNPLLVLRRLRQLLRPGGYILFNQPNLDSAHAMIFGPTWGHWQLPYHRVLTGREGVRRLAMLADLRVVRMHTRTFPYPACISVQLNELGLGAVVPDTAPFSNQIASRGVRLTGWSRLLWDWRGRGDFLFAVLKAV